jgi:putative hemolysin
VKKQYYIIALVIVAIAGLLVLQIRNSPDKQTAQEDITKDIVEDITKKTNTSIANPASTYCDENGGVTQIVSNSDGSQFGMCQFDDYACEEWAYFNGECTLEEDSKMISDALIAKGLNLTEMKVVIYKHLGKYIEGGVVSVSAPAGGGYVFAVKDNDAVKVLADGNGAIMCSAFSDYPDFPSYLVPTCIDENGIAVAR